MAKKLLFGTNLKMYKTVEETVQYLKKLELVKRSLNDFAFELFVIPSYTALYSASRCIDQNVISLGAQNMCWADEGQFTGEISPVMLKELGISIVMSGHSERRHILHDTEDEIHKKVKAALNHGFTSLLCVGETAGEKECRIAKEALRRQIKTAYYDIGWEFIPQIRVAYEPVWSIGVNGIPAGEAYANEMHYEIKSCLTELFGNEAENIPVMYGGSVNIENCEKLILQQYIDGLFVGRSAWDAKKFGKLIQKATNFYRIREKKEK